MDSGQIETAARQKINAVNDSAFWSSAEIQNYLFFSCQEMAVKTNCIEAIYSTTSVASQDQYSKPTLAMGIRRITYNDKKLMPIDQRIYDSLIGGIGTAATGTSTYWWMYNDVINLYPIPDTTALTIKIWTYDEPSLTTFGGPITIPTPYHHLLVEGVCYHMASKEAGNPLVQMFGSKWEAGIEYVKEHMRRKKRGDNFARVHREEDMVSNNIGMV